MAKRKTRRSVARSPARKKSMFDLSPHDEHKVLFLAIGLVFGMALSCLIFGIYTYVGLSALAIGLVLVLIEHREQEMAKRSR